MRPLSDRNIINNGKMNVQTLKPNKSIVTSKIKKNSAKKLSENDGYLLENGSTHLSKGSTHDKASETLTSEESVSSARAEESSCAQPSIFRPMLDYDDRDGTMVLKRANPIYDSDDDEDIEALPLKRQKTLEMTMALQWGERLQETSDGFSSMHLLRE